MDCRVVTSGDVRLVTWTGCYELLVTGCYELLVLAVTSYSLLCWLSSIV
jgi:hypothetical protein